MHAGELRLASSSKLEEVATVDLAPAWGSRSRSRLRGLPATCRGLAVFLVVSASSPGVWQQRATAQSLGPEFRVNTHTISWQSRPAVAADPQGNFVVVWNSYLQDGSGSGVFGQRFDSGGLPLGTEFQVNSYTTNGQRYPAVAVDGFGDFVVVWQSDLQDGSESGVFAQRFDSAGLPVGSEFRVNSYTTSWQGRPAIGSDSQGNFVVVWSSPDGSGSGVVGQRFDSAGLPVGSEFLINSYTTNNQGSPAVAVGGSGGFVVVWDGPGEGVCCGIHGQRLDSGGLPLGGEFPVNSSLGDHNWPTVATDGSDNFVVAWTQYLSPIDMDALARRFDSGGLPMGAQFLVNSYTDFEQASPALAMASSGEFVAAWWSAEQDGSNSGVFGQQFDSAGTPVGSEFQVNVYTTDAQSSAAVATLAPDNLVFVWASFGQDGSSSGVYGRRWLANLVFYDGFETGDTGRWSGTVP